MDIEKTTGNKTDTIISKQLAKAWLYKFSPLNALGVSSGDDSSEGRKNEPTEDN